MAPKHLANKLMREAVLIVKTVVLGRLNTSTDLITNVQVEVGQAGRPTALVRDDDGN